MPSRGASSVDDELKDSDNQSDTKGKQQGLKLKKRN